MPIAARIYLLVLTVFLGGTLPLQAQQPAAEDKPRPCVPLRPLTPQDLDRRESLKMYVLGLLCERQDRLLESLRAFEQAAKLNPEATPVLKALIPLYLALDRSADALAMSKKVLELDPADAPTWYIYARLLRGQGQAQEAIRALNRGLARASLKERPDLRQQMHHDLGVLHENAQHYDKAVAAFGQVVKILEHPEALLELAQVQRSEIVLRVAETYERIGRIHLQAHKYDQAAEAFRQAQARYPDGAGRLSFNLAKIRSEQQRPAEALTHLDTYLRLQPQGTEAYEMKIGLLQQLNREAETVAWLEEASANDKHNVGLKLLLARQYARARQVEKAEKRYVELAEHAPKPEIYRGLFQLYRDADGPGLNKALTLLDRTLQQAKKKQTVVASNPAPAQAQAMLSTLRDDATLAKELLQAALPRLDDDDLRHETLHVLAVLADRNRQPAEAERFYRQCLKGATPSTEALVYGGLLRVLWKARKHEDIIKVCRDGLRTAQATNRVLFHSELARALARLEKTEDALSEAGEAVRLAGDADRLAMRLLRVRILTQARRYEAAEAECQTLLKDATQQGDILEVRYLLSNVYSSAHEYPKAEEQLEWVLKVDPANATACNDLGYLWADQGKNLAEAEKMIRKALELDQQQRKTRPAADADQENAAYVDSLGWVLFRLGKLADARQELEKAVALPDGDDPVLWEHLGDVYFRLEQAARARDAWRRALTLYEQDRRGDRDQRYRDLQQKLKLLPSDTQPR